MILSIDVETGGIDAAKHSLLEFAAVELETERHFTTLVKESEIIVTPGALEVNKIDVRCVAAHGLSPEKAVENFHAWLGTFGLSDENPVYPLGHNIHFDMLFLERLYRLACVPNKFRRLFSYRKRDTSTVARFLIDVGLLQASESSKLSDLCKAVGVEFQEEYQHTAFGDALATARLYKAMRQRVVNLSGGFN